LRWCGASYQVGTFGFLLFILFRKQNDKSEFETPEGAAQGHSPRAVRRSDESVLICPFPAILHKKFPKCVSIPGILLFVLPKSCYFKTA